MNKQKNAAIAIQHLTVNYRESVVLFDLSVAIPQGVFLGVIGPNGAGKTTFLKAILGLIKPLSGSITIFGKSLKENLTAVAYVPQRTSVDWDFPINALDIVLMGLYPVIGWFKWPQKKHVDAALEALGQLNLTELAYKPIGQLSGGQQQRVFLARALVQNAEIFLLDEPFIGVDMMTEKIIIQLLKKLCSEGKTIIVVHHDLQTLSEYFDWLLLLNKKCVAFGPVDQVLKPEYMCAAYGERTLFVQKK